jgi:chemotaxis protein CheZ
MKAWPNDRGLYVQLRRLSEFIAKTREEIAALRPSEVKKEYIPTASDELDAIVEATASATHRIMDAADVVMGACDKLPPEESEKVMNAVTSIYEACTFQDITGQRVTKVVGVLKVIEDRVDRLVAAMGPANASETGVVAPAPAAPASPSPASTSISQNDIDDLFSSGPAGEDQRTRDAKLLNGPALPGQGASQDDVDAILNGTM